MHLEDCLIQCPYCFESMEIEIDPSEGFTQEMVYDCEVCCRPIALQVSYDEEARPVVLATMSS